MGKKKKRSSEQLDGILVLNKPSGPTSADCLNQIKRALKQYKIGHAGTLDPLAHGVLLVMLGNATKLGPYLMGRDKVYRGALKLGQTTDTYDIQGEITSETPVDTTEEKVRHEISAWKELTEQEVPAYSAAKHNGKALYELARAGEEVPVKVKPITISYAEPLDVNLPEAEFRVRCSAGTYIRSLVHSLGSRMSCGAVMTALLREASEPFRLEDAHDLDTVLAEPEKFQERVIPIEDALPHWLRYQVTEPLAALVRNGTRLPAAPDGEGFLAGTPGDRAMLLDPAGKALALVEATATDSGTQWAILRGLWA